MTRISARNRSVPSTAPSSGFIKRVYIRCVNSTPSPFDRAAAAAQASSEWEYRAMQTYHIPLITNPQEVAQAMLEIVA